ncbi:MAG: hypothetical protein E7345_05165 [Clostridiales bacterium]|nr:hypothetical protein [Clostridiales bacterium]
MNKISDIISMPIISMYEGEYLGIAYNLLFDLKNKKCKYIEILNDTDNLPKIIKYSDIYKIGKECIFIKNTECVELKSNLDYELENLASPINISTYNLDGEKVGTSLDVVLNNQTIEEIILNNTKVVKNNEIVNIGKNIILINKNSINLSKFKPKTKINKQPKTDTPVMILSNTTPSINKDTENYTKIITDYRFLIGRILQKDIFAINGEIIAKNGSIITKDIVNKASSYGKLIEVTRYSKKTK